MGSRISREADSSAHEAAGDVNASSNYNEDINDRMKLQVQCREEVEPVVRQKDPACRTLKLGGPISNGDPDAAEQTELQVLQRGQVEVLQVEVDTSCKWKLKLGGSIIRKDRDAEEYQPERKIYLYSSRHRILLVGEGDFSFSNALASAFGSAKSNNNMVATSLDSREELLFYYSTSCRSTLESLKSAGVELLHGVDVTCMARDGRLNSRRFDRIVFNFPHAGFTVGRNEMCRARIRAHKKLLRLFFHNARQLLAEGGEVHVTHHVGRRPYTEWDLEGTAAKAGMLHTQSWIFDKSSFPGYVNRKGLGPCRADTFRLGPISATFVFSIPSVCY